MTSDKEIMELMCDGCSKWFSKSIQDWIEFAEDEYYMKFEKGKEFSDAVEQFEINNWIATINDLWLLKKEEVQKTRQEVVKEIEQQGFVNWIANYYRELKPKKETE